MNSHEALILRMTHPCLKTHRACSQRCPDYQGHGQLPRLFAASIASRTSLLTSTFASRVPHSSMLVSPSYATERPLTQWISPVAEPPDWKPTWPRCPPHRAQTISIRRPSASASTPTWFPSSSEYNTLSKTGHPQSLSNLDLAEKSGNLQPAQRNKPFVGRKTLYALVYRRSVPLDLKMRNFSAPSSCNHSWSDFRTLSPLGRALVGGCFVIMASFGSVAALDSKEEAALASCRGRPHRPNVHWPKVHAKRSLRRTLDEITTE